MIPPLRGEELEYIYCLRDQSGIIKTEHFPDIGSHDSSRVLHLEGKIVGMIFLDLKPIELVMLVMP